MLSLCVTRHQAPIPKQVGSVPSPFLEDQELGFHHPLVSFQ